ncbi:MAG: polysaccharide biosynthesis/export family protein [Gammaproteobacteria bacterium]|nr:polysaccharide biosynthesis/export family protein [Gammaproteobacteria bacterium]
MRRTLIHSWLAVLLICVAGPALAQDITLGAGDVVRISVYGQSDLDTVARITNEGDISFPLVGEVQIAGLTARQAEVTLARLLSEGNFVRNPQVGLFIEQRSTAERDAVTILGQVNRPGRYAVEAISDAGAETIVGLIALAGGVQDDAADHLILTREEEGENTTYRVDLVALLRAGDVSQNHALDAGDIVFAPRMDVFYIYGEVEKPDRYRLERDMTVMQAISVSGGLTQFGTEKGIRIKRRNQEGEIVDYRAKLTDLLRPDDVVHVTS